MERSRKLLLPLAFGMMVFGPFLRWREMKHGLLRDIHGNFLPAEHVPYYNVLKVYFKSPELVTWAHLWFLVYLWTFTVLYAPLWAFLSPAVAKLVANKTGRAKSILHLSAFAITASEILFRERWPGYQNLIDDWANFTSYSVYLILGLLVGSLPIIKQTVSQYAAVFLAAGLAASACHAGFCFEVSMFLASVIYAVVWCLSSCCLLLIWLS